MDSGKFQGRRIVIKNAPPRRRRQGIYTNTMTIQNDALEGKPDAADTHQRAQRSKPVPVPHVEFFQGIAVRHADTVQCRVTRGSNGALNDHLWNRGGADFPQWIVEKTNAVKPAYFSLFGFHPDAVSQYAGRTKDNAVVGRIFGIDVEGSSKKFAKADGPGKGYANGVDALAAIKHFVKASGIKPNFLVDTGSGGWHLYYVLDKDYPPEIWLSRAKCVVRLAKLHRLKIDAPCTTNAAQIMRAPGSIHQDTGKVVTAYRLREAPYTLEEFDQRVGYVLDDETPPKAPESSASNADSSNDIIGNREYSKYSYQQAAMQCGSMREAAANNGRDTAYPVWILALRAAALSTEGAELAHEVSSGHADYDPVETEKKLSSLNGGPAGCTAWAAAYGVGGPCDTCTHRGMIKNPAIQLGSADSTQSGSAAGAGTLPTNATDLALAKIFVGLHAGNIKRDHSLRKWRHYIGGTWPICAMGEPIERVKGCASFILGMAAKAHAIDPDSVTGKKLQALALRAQNQRSISAALILAESDPAVAVTADMFDCDPDLFNVANGVVHLPTGQFLPHAPDLLLSKQSPVEYVSGAKCPVFLLYMEQISCNDPDWIDYMQRQLGYILCGRVHEEKLFFWFGDGRNGKSVLANVLRYIMGDYAVIAPVAMFMSSKRDGADATPQLAMLPGKRLMLANETEAGARLSAQMLKVAVSTEHISARALHGNPFSFEPTHKAVMRGNHLPIIQEGDEGTWRRIDLVPFDLKLDPSQCDPDLERKLRAEAPGILLWLIKGHLNWKARGMVPAVRVRNASNAYRKNSDVIANWLADECVIAANAEVEKATAYMRYRMWAVDEGLRCMAKKSLTRALVERGYTEGRQATGARKEVYRGFKCK